MGRKRKAIDQPFGQAGEKRTKHNYESRLAINTFEDVADSEDEFHINRDKILLDETPTQKGQRIAQEEDAVLEPSDEEVLPTSDEDDTESENQLEEVEEELGGRTQSLSRKKLGKPLKDSDSDASAAEEDQDQDLQGWGSSRKDYYNADHIETEADALEEEVEARRLQQKQLQGMTEADFGLDQLDWLGPDQHGEDERSAGHGKAFREVLPKLKITDTMDPEEKSRIMKILYPEFEPLAAEFVELQEPYMELEKKAFDLTSKTRDIILGTEDFPMSVVVMKSRALGAYLSALSIYFAILTSTAKDPDGESTAMAPEQLRDHSIMGTLVHCRDLWNRMKHLEEREPLSQTSAEGPDAGQLLNGDIEKQGPPEHPDAEAPPPKRESRKSKAQRALEAAQASASEARLARIRETEASLADLSALTTGHPAPSSKSTHAAYDPDDSSDIGEATALTPAEAAEKAARNKKTLRFYTSQITQKSTKRGAAGRDAGGDADLPYRERLKDKQARLQAEAEERGKRVGAKRKNQGADLGGESDNEDAQGPGTASNGVPVRGAGEDYYELVSSQSAKKKADKAALAALHAQAAAEGGIVRVVEEEGNGGKRAISYAIEKNKGLTPKRKKDVRNPRVKKRKKFEEKKKKLGSVRPVFKGGEGRGGYKGELTGIKKGLIRGTRL